ncbi:MAG: DUF4386 domain-containing protein [Candidatus Thorarchaeota archaeon]|nr:MAG: DUF4386 domain-containing protein [Candidatus Thorarchaeota archaeon]
MSQGLALDRRECARNSGIFILVRLLLGSFVFLSLGTIFYVPSETMIAAAQGIKANVFFFIGVMAVLFFMSLFSLIIGIPLNNVLTSVNKYVSKVASRLRMIEVLFFVASMVLLFADASLFFQVLLLAALIYGLHLIIIGYLVIISGYLSRFVGVLLIGGASIGYLSEIVTHSFIPGVILLSTYGVVVAIIGEVSLALVLIVEAMRLNLESPDTKERVVRILERLGEATTSEIIHEASKESDECKDRVPKNLIALENERVIAKRLSKEKKGYVWSLVG